MNNIDYVVQLIGYRGLVNLLVKYALYQLTAGSGFSTLSNPS